MNQTLLFFSTTSLFQVCLWQDNSMHANFSTANLDQKRAKFEKKCLVNAECGKKSQEGKLNDTKAMHRETVEADFDLLIGADGAHSVTRQQLSRYAKIDFQQTWVDILWCEFHIPSYPDGRFQLAPDHLHLWPQKSCMFIASPNTVRRLFLSSSRLRFTNN